MFVDPAYLVVRSKVNVDFLAVDTRMNFILILLINKCVEVLQASCFLGSQVERWDQMLTHYSYKYISILCILHQHKVKLNIRLNFPFSPMFSVKCEQLVHIMSICKVFTLWLKQMPHKCDYKNQSCFYRYLDPHTVELMVYDNQLQLIIFFCSLLMCLVVFKRCTINFSSVICIGCKNSHCGVCAN